MSLGMMGAMMTPCRRLVETPAGADGLRGHPVTYADGEAFKALLIKSSAGEIHIAERQDLSERYTVVVEKGVSLAYNEVFRRESDGRTFRCVTSTIDAEAPEVSTVPIAKCEAERWDLP